MGDDCQIKPDITFRKKNGEVFVGFSRKLDQGVSNKTHTVKKCLIPKNSPSDKNSDESVADTSVVSTDNHGSAKKHKTPCRIRRNKRKLAELKRKIEARKLAAKPPVSTENRQSDSFTVAGSPVAVSKEFLTAPTVTESKGAGIKPSTHVDDGKVSSNISELSNVKQVPSTPSRKLYVNNSPVVNKPKKTIFNSGVDSCQRLPRLLPVLPSIRRVMGHAYQCEKCFRDASDIEEKMYLCKPCSRRSLNDRHICLQCYENSDLIDCALTLIDCG